MHQHAQDFADADLDAEAQPLATQLGVSESAARWALLDLLERLNHDTLRIAVQERC
ncbi:hypothetical protein [Deinococcus aestuarii]|uniref:hypothetical protein n=1 Tax=Deinococcus aestuarii TaxID=2774531 RepID=UPI001C0B8CFC|nr:hypothetical protein [Deinococcus aestuarii]